MFRTKSETCLLKAAITTLWLIAVNLFAAWPVAAQNKVIGTYTFLDTPIKEFQNKLLPKSIVNDRKVLLGSVGSDLWHGAKDARDEFWMITEIPSPLPTITISIAKKASTMTKATTSAKESRAKFLS